MWPACCVQDAEKEDYEEKLKEIQDVCGPIISKVGGHRGRVRTITPPLRRICGNVGLKRLGRHHPQNEGEHLLPAARTAAPASYSAAACCCGGGAVELSGRPLLAASCLLWPAWCMGTPQRDPACLGGVHSPCLQRAAAASSPVSALCNYFLPPDCPTATNAAAMLPPPCVAGLRCLWGRCWRR